MQQLSHTSFIPVNKTAVEQYGDNWTAPGHIVTDGPFMLKSWKHDASLTLTKNPDYYDASSVKLSQVNLKIIPDGSTAEQAFNANNVDVNETGWPPSDTPNIKKSSAYKQFPSLGIYYYGFNVKNITDVNQRRAMALAIDRKTIVDHITQTGQVPATNFTPAGIAGSSSINTEKFLPPTANMTLAQQYMSKVANPVTDITLIFNNAPGHKEIATAVQSQWQQLGLHVTLKQQDWPQFLKFLGPPPDASVDAFRMGWIADYPGRLQLLEHLPVRWRQQLHQLVQQGYDNLLKQATATSDQRSVTSSTRRPSRC